MRLTRRFGRPPLSPTRHVISLRMDHVPGIDVLELNGRSITPVSPHLSSYRIELDDLAERNVLVLEVEPLVDKKGGARPEPWGVIALVISPVDD